MEKDYDEWWVKLDKPFLSIAGRSVNGLCFMEGVAVMSPRARYRISIALQHQLLELKFN